VSTPRNAHQPPGRLGPRRFGQRPRDLGLELLAANHQRVHGAAIVLQGALRRRLPHAHARQPAEIGLGPVGLRAVEANLMAQQQLGQPVARAHQIAAQILTGTHQITQRLLLHARDRDRTKLTGHQQPDQALGIAAIGLHAIRRPPRDQPRRAHHTLHPHRPQLARQHEPRRPRLIRRAHRPRQRARERRHLVA
jgi:hypothetical protein